MTEAANINIRYGQTPDRKVSFDDAELVNKYRQGDSEAMERLLIKYQNRIYNVILKICADPDDAAELTQETFVKIIENIHKFEGRSRFYTWAFRVAVNLTLNYCQRKAKLTLSSLDVEKDRYNNQQIQVLKEFLSDENSPDPETMAQNKELCELAVQALKKLDEAQRAVVVLRDIEGMNYAQIADVLNIELGTVRSRLSRARGRLRKILEASLL